jgi:Ras-related GTP-binding protein C/D
MEDQILSDKPRILLMGLQRYINQIFFSMKCFFINKPSRSGKSSIQRVVFGKMPPNDTLYLESTTKIQKEDIT